MDWIFKGWLRNTTAAQTIVIEGGTLSIKSPPRNRSLSMYRLRYPVPGKLNYDVEYRVSDNGEFIVGRGIHGGIVVKNNQDERYSIPVCWLPKRFVGKNVDRYIVRVDGKQVHYKTGARDVVRPSPATIQDSMPVVI